MNDILISIATYKELSKAVFLKERLESEDIECFLADENFHETASKYITGVKVQVRGCDVERSIKVMLKVNELYGQIDVEEEYKKILVPIDFSTYSFNACQYAIGLAQKLNAEIKLLHIYDDPLVDAINVKKSATYLEYAAQVINEAERKAKDEMVKFSNELRAQLDDDDLKNIRIHYSILKGSPDIEIATLSDTYKPEVIILGTRGSGEKTSDLIGSVTTKVIERTKVPILTIPENCVYTGINRINILYGTDFYDSDFTSFHKLLAITGNLDVKIFCIHIETEEPKPWKETKMNELNDHLAKEYNNVDVECHLIESEDLLKGMQEFIDENQIDIISFTSPKRSIFYKLLNPNNLKKMVYQSKIPMLIFRY